MKSFHRILTFYRNKKLTLWFMRKSSIRNFPNNSIFKLNKELLIDRARRLLLGEHSGTNCNQFFLNTYIVWFFCLIWSFLSPIEFLSIPHFLSFFLTLVIKTRISLYSSTFQLIKKYKKEGKNSSCGLVIFFPSFSYRHRTSAAMEILSIMTKTALRIEKQIPTLQSL
jgi:hypothetical protein